MLKSSQASIAKMEKGTQSEKGHIFPGKTLNRCRFSGLPRACEKDNPRIAKGFFNLLFNKSRVHVRNAPSVFFTD